jgi:hypothetical protein
MTPCPTRSPLPTTSDKSLRTSLRTASPIKAAIDLHNAGGNRSLPCAADRVRGDRVCGLSEIKNSSNHHGLKLARATLVPSGAMSMPTTQPPAPTSWPNGYQHHFTVVGGK